MMSNQRLRDLESHLNSDSLIDDIAYSAVFYGEVTKSERPDFNVSCYRHGLEEYLSVVEQTSPSDLQNLMMNGYAGVFNRFMSRLIKKDRPDGELVKLLKYFMKLNIYEARIFEEAEDIDLCREYASQIDDIRRIIHDGYGETELYRGFDPFVLPVD